MLRRERPDALLPTLGGQTALNLAIELAGGRRARRARRRADRRAGRRDPPRRGPRALPRGGAELRPRACRTRGSSPRSTTSPASRCPRSSGPPSRSAATAAASPRPRRSCARQVERGLRESPIGQVLVEESVRGWDEFELEVIRDRQRQRRHRLLDREPRPDGRPHRRLGHGRAADDALRRGLPGAARRGGRRSSARSASRPAARTSSSRATARPASSA